MSIGLPYQGSKATIAEDIVKAIPKGGKILDACCGGGAFLMGAEYRPLQDDKQLSLF